jgi:hypothetical protein
MRDLDLWHVLGGRVRRERDLARTSIAPEAHVGSSSDVTIDIDIDNHH